MTPRTDIPAATPDVDCGPHTGEFVMLASFGAHRPATPDPLTERTRRTWSAGDFTQIAAAYTAGAEAFVQRLALVSGTTVLDVACGSGNLALPAARLGARVTGIDIAPNLVEAARLAAKREGLPIDLHEGDAEALPYPDATFETTISMFGVMFAPRPELAMAELFRVTRPGGRIALANWTPGSFIGEMLRAHVKRVPPPAGVPSSLAWGDRDQVAKRLQPHAPRIKQVQLVPRTIELAFPHTSDGVVELFRETYGPTVRTFDALEPDGRADLTSELRALWQRFPRGADGVTRAQSEYLEVLVELA